MCWCRRIFCVVGITIICACDPQLTDDPIPLTTFNDIVINLGLPLYNGLRQDRGIMSFNGGVRGIIVYHVSGNTYNAYERNCSFHPNEAGSTVDIDPSNLFLKDFSCGSSFKLEDGQPMGGPAWRPLRRYRTDVTGGILTITPDIIE